MFIWCSGRLEPFFFTGEGKRQNYQNPGACSIIPDGFDFGQNGQNQSHQELLNRLLHIAAAIAFEFLHRTGNLVTGKGKTFQIELFI